MAKVRLFHWRAEEAKELIRQLNHAGYEVEYPGEKENGSFRSLRQGGFHAAVLNLTRLPSHARYVAMEIRAHKATRHLPMVFVDGDPAKLERIQRELPDAVFTARAKLIAVLKRVKPVENPAPATSMMASYAGRTTGQKMGFKAGSRIAVIDAPRDYAKAIGDLPAGASFEEDPTGVLPFTLWFVHDRETYLASLPRMRKLAQAKSRLWVVWPKAASKKGAGSGVTQTLIRESAIAVGLVDYKICSVDETWSAMVFAVKK
jgi:hypothetical protein